MSEYVVVKREVVERALEALNSCKWGLFNQRFDDDAVAVARAMLRAASQDQHDAPAAWMVAVDGEHMRPFVSPHAANGWIADERRGGSPYDYKLIPLYAAPQGDAQ